MTKIIYCTVFAFSFLFIGVDLFGQTFPGASWATATPASQGLDETILKNNFNALSNKGNVIVIKNGYQVYTTGNVATPLAVYSESMSLTALFAARALQLGKIKLDDAVPGSNVPSGGLATYKHFLTMTSDFGLTPHSPGSNFAYNNYAVDHYGSYMLANHFGNVSKANSLNSILFSQLGGNQDNISFAGIMSGWGEGWKVSARDMARLGLLISADGNWNGDQVISKSFCDALYVDQIPSAANINLDKGPNDQWNQHEKTRQLKGNYSYGFWLLSRTTNKYTEPITSMSGYKGNKVFIIKNRNIVISVTNTVVDESGRPTDAAYIDAVLNAISSGTPPPPTNNGFPRGRIVLTNDGNAQDPDDIGALPMEMALLEAQGLKDNVVLIEHSNNYAELIQSQYDGMKTSASGAAQRFGYSSSIIYDAYANPTAATNKFISVINASSSSNPLWIIASGPMESIWRAITGAQKDKRQYLRIISHSWWNEEYTKGSTLSHTWAQLKSTYGADGVIFYDIIDQNTSNGDNDMSTPLAKWSWLKTLATNLGVGFTAVTLLVINSTYRMLGWCCG